MKLKSIPAVVAIIATLLGLFGAITPAFAQTSTVSYNPPTQAGDIFTLSAKIGDSGRVTEELRLQTPGNILEGIPRASLPTVLTVFDDTVFDVSFYTVPFDAKIMVPRQSDTEFPQLGLSWRQGNLYTTPVPMYAVADKRFPIIKLGDNKTYSGDSLATIDAYHGTVQYSGSWDSVYKRSLVWEFTSSADTQGLEITLTGIYVTSFVPKAQQSIDNPAAMAYTGGKSILTSLDKGDKFQMASAIWGFFPVTVEQPRAALELQPQFDLLQEQPVAATFFTTKGDTVYARLDGNKAVFDPIPRQGVGAIYTFIGYEPNGKAKFKA